MVCCRIEFGEKELKKLGLNALLGVGQGSANETYLVTIEWNGKKQTKKFTYNYRCKF